MTPPPPRDRGRPLGRSLLAAAVLGGLALVFVLTLLPPPQPATLVTRVLVLHNTIVAPRISPADPTRPPVPPEVQATLTSTLDDVEVDSWLYRSGPDRVTAHRVAAPAELPRNAGKLTIGGKPGRVFDADDLSVLAWSDGAARTWFVVGDAPVHRLRDIADWVRTKD